MLPTPTKKRRGLVAADVLDAFIARSVFTEGDEMTVLLDVTFVMETVGS
jgi:hypothetical protein